MESGKIIALENLAKILNDSNQSLKKVLVTGCFDIIHKAHKDFLKVAKAKGDLLIIGLESDTRVKKLKGKNRPINSWQKRAEKLAAFNAVDFIFPLALVFDKRQTHLKLLYLIKPDVLAVSENTPFLKQKKRLIKKTKIRLFIFKYNSKYSTTKILGD